MLDRHDPMADRPQKPGRVFEFRAEVPRAHRTSYDSFARGAPSLQSGMKLLIGKSDFNAALPLFQRAIDLDPNFRCLLLRTGVDLSQSDGDTWTPDSRIAIVDVRTGVPNLWA